MIFYGSSRQTASNLTTKIDLKNDEWFLTLF